MDFGIFAGKRPVPHPSSVSKYLPLFWVVCGAVVLLVTTGRTRCGWSDIPPPGSPIPSPTPATRPSPSARESDEAIISRLLLREEMRFKRVTYVGIEENPAIVTDPGPALLRDLQALNPAARPVSDLPKSYALDKKTKYVLVTASVVMENGRNQARAVRSYLFSNGGCSGLHYTAKRSRGSKTGWSLQPEGRGCGYWKSVTIRTTDGDPVKISQ